jgi:hypothetical protein
VTLGALGGAVKPATRDELLELARTSPVTNVVMVGRVLAISEPVIREMARNGELQAMGIRVLRLGAQYRVPVADILAVLGISPDTGSAGPAPPADPAGTTH